MIPIGMKKNIVIYQTSDGKKPFQKWLSKLDRAARARVTIAIGKLEDGNIGSLKSIGNGVYEIRIFYGPGYRVYLGQEGSTLVILLHGGTKKRQSDDINLAKQLWLEYKAENQGGN
jgi:putative addiction module killer protein